MEPTWTLSELVAEVAARTAALPAPRNGQVRAVPDERTIRYYATLGLLDRPSATRGRIALYGRRHAAQLVTIKRLQSMGRALSEIQALWPSLDDCELERMSGMPLQTAPIEPSIEPPIEPRARARFWSHEPRATSREPRPVGLAAAPASDVPVAEHTGRDARGDGGEDATSGSTARSQSDHPLPRMTAGALARDPPATPLVELRVELAPRVVLSLSTTDDPMTVSLADVRAIRAASAPLLAELASRHLAIGTDPEIGGDE